LAVTVTFKVAVAVEFPSLACRVKVEFVAEQLAEMLAVMVPFVF